MALKNRIAVMVVLAIGTGAAASIGAERYLSSQVAETVTVVEQAPAVVFRTIVAAAKPLRYGTELSASNLVEIPWPEDAIPTGAFARIEDVIGAGRRVALMAIEPNEPVLKTKVTGPDGRAGLASLISQGMRAATVRVNDVAGVAGFILPGDRVDVVWTRNDRQAESLATVLQQNVRVLTIDQIADQRSEDPRVAQAVTLEVDAEGAQRLTLASATGSLSLVLRRSGDTTGASIASVSVLDLDRSRGKVADEPAVEPTDVAAPRPRVSTVWVTHAETRLQHTVPSSRAPGIVYPADTFAEGPR